MNPKSARALIQFAAILLVAGVVVMNPGAGVAILGVGGVLAAASSAFVSGPYRIAGVSVVVLTLMALAQRYPESQRLDESFASTAERRAIRAAYEGWVSAAEARDLGRWLSFLAPEALFLPPDHAPLRGEDSIGAFYAALFADPRFSIECEQEDVEVAASRDMAWSSGTCEVALTGRNGEPASDSSKWIKVWKKQPDGQWKCAVNSWNSGLGESPVQMEEEEPSDDSMKETERPEVGPRWRAR